MKKTSFILFISFILLLSACGGVAPEVAQAPPEPAATEVPPTETPLPPPTLTAIPPTGTPTETPAPAVEIVTGNEDEAEAESEVAAEPTVLPTDTPISPAPTPEPPTATPEPEVDWLASFGRTEDNLMYLGNPDAPVTLTDYSDFM